VTKLQLKEEKYITICMRDVLPYRCKNASTMHCI
jgi:hypothetical protein